MLLENHPLRRGYTSSYVADQEDVYPLLNREAFNLININFLADALLDGQVENRYFLNQSLELFKSSKL